ncbi:MAG TPA: serine/threonine-protein kinase, partial [Gemmatimonadales bacterium]
MAEPFQQLRAALEDRYTLEREIGAGGMATVYLARDLRHRRPVALKVIRPELGGSDGLQRFLREIELAAGLQHPHILPVFDSGAVEVQGGAALPYFVMPYVEGETLRHRLSRDGPLRPETAATLAAEVADALTYAHAHGVVHRDIKPENILLSGGHAMVADFGVAKALAGGVMQPVAAGAGLTAVGIALGTPHYMSPEQATGRDLVDARSDQYSLGCVLYEMLTGAPPFTGDSAQSVIAKAMTAPRPRPGRARPGIPAFLDQVVTRAMAADPADRYPSMAALAAALGGARALPAQGKGRRRGVVLAGVALAAAAGLGLWLTRRPAAGTVAPAAERLAVLPFNTSGVGVEFLGEGMVDLLSTNLGGVGGIRTVDPRTVLRQAEGADQGEAVGLERALGLGRKLGAGSVVIGSAVGTGERVRLSADFYSIQGDRLGRAQVDGPADSVLPLVDRLSLALLRDVWRSREPIPAVRLASQTTDSLEALRAYLQGEQYYRRLVFDSAQQAYSRAVEIDSTFALAHLRRALTYGWTGGYGSPPSREAGQAGSRFAHKLPPRERRLLGGYRVFAEGKPASVDSFRTFLAQHPDDLDGWYLLGEALYHTREFTGAPPDSINAAFDRVVRGDSGLVPALLHPVELTLLTRDSMGFARYLPVIERNAPARATLLRAYADAAFGSLPGDSVVRSLRDYDIGHLLATVNAVYQNEAATSDSVLTRFRWAAGLGPETAEFRVRSLQELGLMNVGLGRLEATRAMADTLISLGENEATGLLA